MSARILAIRNGEIEKVLAIEQTSSRFGGAQPSDLIVSGLPPHSFSLEFNEGVYWVLNTGSETLYLDESVIPRGSQMAWESSEVLQVSKELTLKMELEGDPSPKPIRRTFLGIRPKDLLTDSEKTERNHQTRLALALGAIVCGIMFFSYHIVFSKPDTDRRVREGLEGVLSALSDYSDSKAGSTDHQSSREDIDDLAKALKRARVAELENDPTSALLAYASIRNHIREKHRNGTREEYDHPVFAKVGDFVWEQEQANGLSVVKGNNSW